MEKIEKCGATASKQEMIETINELVDEINMLGKAWRENRRVGEMR